MHDIDRDWFLQKLEEKDKSVRGLARHLDIDASAVSRMFSGQRRMKMEEANAIALFLGVPVKEILNHVGVSLDLDGRPTRILLTSIIDGDGNMKRLPDPKPLMQNIIDRLHAAVGDRNRRVIAAQVRAGKGALAVMDDAVVLLNHTDGVDPSAIGVLSVCRTADGQQFLGKVERARKTGEATCMKVNGKAIECILVTATPVLAIIP